MTTDNDCTWLHDYLDEGKKCWYWMPDSIHDCDGCNNCGVYKEDKKMEEKFKTKEVKLEGVGKDAEVVTNEKGGKQSKAPCAMHLIDPDFLDCWFNPYDNTSPDFFIRAISEFMITLDKRRLLDAVFDAYIKLHGEGTDENKALIDIAKVLQEGASKYKPNNWRLIPEEEHLNHALIHYLAWKLGDTQDDHLQHCMCRLMMTFATKRSPNFTYGEYLG